MRLCSFRSIAKSLLVVYPRTIQIVLCNRISDFPGDDVAVLLRLLEGVDEQIIGGLVGPLRLTLLHCQRVLYRAKRS